MPVSIRSEPEHEIVYVTFSGDLTTEVVRAAMRQAQEFTELEKQFDQLIDTRDVREVLLTPDSVRTLADVKFSAVGVRRAVVASNDVMFGLARMFGLLRDLTLDPVEVFRDPDEALKWLDCN